MKKLFLLFFIICYASWSYGQSIKNADAKKLLDFYQTQQYSEAVKLLQGIFKPDTEEPSELSQLAYANLMAGNFTAAERDYLKLHALQPASLPVLFSLASISNHRGDHQKAIAYYQEVLKNDTTNFVAYKQLGLLNKVKLNPQYLEELKKANQLNPLDADVVVELCDSYVKEQLFDAANAILTPALQADSANLKLLKMKMPISMANKAYAEVIATGEKVLSSGDSATTVLNTLGRAHLLLLDYPHALNYFLLIKDKSFDKEALAYNIGLSYRGIKDFEKAIPYLQTAIQEGVSPKMASYFGLLGDSYENVNKNDNANAAYKKGLQFENNGSLYYNIALVYETKLNDKKNAISYYEQYLKTINAEKQPKQVIFIKNKIAELKK